MSPSKHDDSEPTGAEDDAALVRDALAGAPAAVEQVAQRLAGVLRTLRVLNRRHGQRLSEHDVEDLAQDAALRIWRKLPSFRGQTTLGGWLYQFCYFEYLNRMRTCSRALPREPVDVERLAVSPQGDPMDVSVRRLEECLAELGPPDADVIRIKHFDGLSFTAIGARLNTSPSTVKARYYRGLAWLQRRLRAEVQEVRP